MSTQEDQIRQLQAALEALRIEVQELRERTYSPTEDNARLSRRTLLRTAGAAVAGAAASALVIPGAAPVEATDGQAVVAGQDNTDTATTSVSGSVLGSPALRASNYFSGPFDNWSDAFQAYTYGGGFAAVYGRNDHASGTAIQGRSAGGVALSAAGSGRLQQDANLPAGPPGYTPTNFEQVRDGNGALWLSDATGAWRRINTLIPITPVRVLDTRFGQGATGPIPTNGTITLTLAGTNGIPSNAVGIVANLTATSQTGNGWLAIYPAGTPFPGTSNVNFGTSIYAIANSVIVRLGNGAVTILVNVINNGSANVLLDLFGYIQ